MENFEKKKLAIIGISLLIFISVIVCFFISNNNQNKEAFYVDSGDVQEQKNEENMPEIKQKIFIHVAGEVNNPGVIEALEGDRIKDVIDKVGGFTAEANIDRVNLAYEVKDGQKIIIPNKNEKSNLEQGIEYYVKDGDYGNIVEGESSSKKVNINTASQTELETLNGIGASAASKIIEYRKSNGKFKKIEDIKNVTGIGEAKFKNIQNEICVK